jgi:hypothetical protein
MDQQHGLLQGHGLANLELAERPLKHALRQEELWYGLGGPKSVWKAIKQKPEVSRCMVLNHNKYYSGNWESTHQEGCSLLDPPSHAFLCKVLGAVIIPKDGCGCMGGECWQIKQQKGHYY